MTCSRSARSRPATSMSWVLKEGACTIGRRVTPSMSYTANTYGDRIAAVYDEWVGPIVDPTTDACAAFLAEIAGSGPVLELGIGTGRIALPLAARGLSVHGIDASQAMVDQLRDK